MYFTFFGLVGALSISNYVLIGFVLTFLTIISVTLYLHRSKAHGGVDFNSAVEHFFRFWLWLTTGMKTHEWVATHRRHHAKCESIDDPHSPIQKGLWRILLLGWLEYNRSAKDPKTLAYVKGLKSNGLPNDWMETNIYSKHNWLGISLLLITEIMLFGFVGLAIWSVQMAWIPFWAAGVINGIGHFFGYRNADTPDNSRNIIPWGILIGGEELHNNHHLYPTSAKFSQRWFEVDIGWGIIRFLAFLKLAKIKRVSSFPVHNEVWERKSDEFFRIFIHHRWVVAKWYRELLSTNSFNGRAKEIVDEFRSFLNSGAVNFKSQELCDWCNKINCQSSQGLTDDENHEFDILSGFARHVRSMREVKTI